jgi:hypothetical protein
MELAATPTEPPPTLVSVKAQPCELAPKDGLSISEPSPQADGPRSNKTANGAIVLRMDDSFLDPHAEKSA